MARIPYFDPNTAPERVTSALAGKRRINVFRMIANAENAAPEVFALGHRLSRGSSLDPVHREVVILRTAAVNGADYQWNEHMAVARRVGFTDQRIDAVRQYPEPAAAALLEPFERTLIEFTDAVISTTTAPADLFETVRAEYDDSKLVELVLLIGFYMMVGRVMNTFEIELETGPVDTF